MRRSLLGSARPRSEQGAAAVMVAVSAVALCLVAATVLDFGMARFDKQSNKSAADTSATAGIWALDNGTGMSMSFRGACEARAYVRANQPDLKRAGVTLSETWRTGTGAVISGNPCDRTSAQWNTPCEPADRTTWAWYEATALGGRLRVTIKSAYDVSEPYDGRTFPEENVGADSGSAMQGGCDQLAVIIREQAPPTFGTVVTGNSGLTTTVRTVGRVIVGTDGFAPVALLLLEQADCLAITTASTNAKVVIKGTGDHPGRIHSDSLGNGSCSTGQQVIDSSHADGIKALKAVTGTLPGLISVRALLAGETGARPDRAFDDPPAVVAEGSPDSKPTGGKLVTRRPVDLRYRYAVRTEMANAPARWSTVPANGSTDIDGNLVRVASGPDCTTLSSAAMQHTGTLFIDCPGGISYSSSVTINARTLVVNGPVTVRSGNSFDLPSATKVYIKGGSSGLNVSGTWQMNRTGQPTCPAYNLPSRARLVIGQGGVTANVNGAVLRMCHTAALLMGDGATGCVPSTAGTAPTTTTSCSSANVDITGGMLDWTAPDSEATTSTLGAWAEFEDLALWTESSGTNRIGGNANMVMAGVFFLPNANPFTLGGSGSQSVENAQYVVRKLSLGGTSTMEMRPDPNDAVSIPFMTGFSLVR